MSCTYVKRTPLIPEDRLAATWILQHMNVIEELAMKLDYFTEKEEKICYQLPKAYRKYWNLSTKRITKELWIYVSPLTLQK